MIKGLNLAISIMRSYLKYFKVHYIRYCDNEKQIKQVKNSLLTAFLNFKSRNLRNLEKNFPLFLEE
jgi:hypothetical protein